MRSCGSCSECCTYAAVPDLDKPAFQPCAYIRTAPQGCCSIVDDPSRPKLCQTFDCAWRMGVGEPSDRPDVNGAIFSINLTDNGRIGFVVETEADAVTSTARDMAVAFATQYPLPLVVSPYMKRTPGEFVILHDTLRERAQSMLGAEVCTLGKNVTMYELRTV